MFKRLVGQKESRIEEGHLMPHHVHMLISIPPKHSVNSHVTVWSCLAAHAAILHTDGIRRAKRNDKLFGIFECAKVSDHPLTVGLPASFRLPHSRWNGVPEDQLLDCGFTVLAQSAEAGPTHLSSSRKGCSSFSRVIQNMILIRCFANIAAMSVATSKWKARRTDPCRKTISTQLQKTN